MDYNLGYFGQLEYSRAEKKCTLCGPDVYAEPLPMHCTGKQDTIYIYDASDRSKQKLPVDKMQTAATNITHELRMV